ncbi:MAG: triose-phosphate isomerase [Motiliproteus sp.]|nr:triose-phosphate isomerase [Motiliproteus sp.]MCW9052134.1 triose-phosphate isomerase [Motiliproteus sp.]
MRRLLVAGNWKMNGSKEQAEQLVTALVQGFSGSDQVEMVLCPPTIYLDQVAGLLNGSAIGLGSQNSSEHEAGAYTGETAPAMLLDMGCRYAILGHSERRTLYGEDNALVAAKFEAAKAAGLTPILCVGETLEQREAGETLAVVAAQVGAVLARLGNEAFAEAVIAYEPVWAIGTGKTATPEQAQEVHAAIRAQVADSNAQVAERVQILYGGSVNAGNAETLFAMQDIDGGLVGGASLKADDFLAICQSANG